MRHGLDTGFSIAHAVIGHPQHAGSDALVRECLSNGDDFALTPQVLAEFVHVLTDPKRFTQPLTMEAALRRAEMRWSAPEVAQVFPTNAAVEKFGEWMNAHRLGRKRILDTLLAATYFTAGVTSLVTTNSRDFRTFGVFSIVEP